MDDVDGITLSILRDLGCILPLSLTSLTTFTAEQMVHVCVRVLQVWGVESRIPSVLPDGKPSRVRVCAEVARVLQENGYTGEVGYETLLYPNEKDTRQIVTWLVGKLPKSGEVDGEGSIVQGGVGRKIGKALEQWKGAVGKWNKFSAERKFVDGMSKRYIPVEFETSVVQVPSKNVSASIKIFNSSRYLPFVAEQTIASKLIPSLLEKYSRDLIVYAEAQSRWNSQELNVSDSDLQRKKNVEKILQEGFKNVCGRERKADDPSKFGESASAWGEQDSLGYQYDPSHSIAAALQGILHSAAGVAANEDSTATDSTFSRRNYFTQEKEVTVAHVVEASSAPGQLQTVVQVVEDETTGGMKQIKQEDEDALQQKREGELRELHVLLNEVIESVNSLKKQNDAAILQQKEWEAEKKRFEDLNVAAEKDYTTKKQTLELLPDASKNVATLMQMVEANKKRISDLQKQWEAVKAPYLEEYNTKKNLLANRKEECRIKLEQIKRMREEMKEMMNLLREKDDQHAQVVDELNKLPKSVNRQVYVKRIMDIVRNLERQKVDIKRILADIRDVQREINTVSQTSLRSFALADDIIFRAAQTTKDSAALKSYALLVEFRDKFEELIKIVSYIGATCNETRDIEAKASALQERNVNLNMERVQNDYESVKADNASLSKKLQKLQRCV